MADPKPLLPMKTLLSILAISLTATLAQATPVNDKCPVCDKTARLIFRTKHNGQHIIFFSADCMEKFTKSPSSYKVKPKS
jgi:YHS domain-containing protein